METETSTKAATTEPPTDAEWQDHLRWAVQPVGTRRGMWVRREAAAIALAEGRPSAWPTLDDHERASARIPADY